MSYTVVSRVLFGLLLLNEAVVVSRATPEERAAAPMPRPLALVIVALLLPLVIRLRLPAPIGWLAVALQASGLGLELSAEWQLSRARSFAIDADAATQPQQHGLYRLEHPIYLGLLLQLFGWALAMPLALVAVLAQYRAFQRAVAAERAHLARLGVVHRGWDSWLWSRR